MCCVILSWTWPAAKPTTTPEPGRKAKAATETQPLGARKQSPTLGLGSNLPPAPTLKPVTQAAAAAAVPAPTKTLVRQNKGKTIEHAKKLKENLEEDETMNNFPTFPPDPGYNATWPKMAFLTYSHLNGTSRFEDLIFPSLDTWHPGDIDGVPYYIVISDIWKQTYEELIDKEQGDPNFIKYQRRMHLVFVPCGEGKTFEPECCKQEEGMLYMVDHFRDVYDWIIYLDDDNYVRVPYMRQYLSTLPTDQTFVATGGPNPRFLGVFGYLPQKSPYKCSKHPQYQYPWGQVVAYNRATLQLMEKGLRLGAITKQCREYQVFHDVGNAIVHWMYRLPELHLVISDRPNEMRSELMGAHGVGRCFGVFTCFMDEIHRQMNFIFYKPPTRENYKYEWRNFTEGGYSTTRTFQQYGDPWSWSDEWHTMPISDCKGPFS